MATLRRYFDNAATSFPKPPGVVKAVTRYMTGLGAPGRGAYAEARTAAGLVELCRARINTLINGPGADRVVFTHNTTDALNLAIKGVLRHALASRKGRVHVVTTCTEHNSVLRPLRAMAAEHARIDLTIAGCDPATGLIHAEELLRAVRPGRTSLVVVNHASNVTGALQPLAQIGPAVRAASDGTALLLVDAAQSLGHAPVDMTGWCVDLLAFPGHKGLLGPQGTGGLALGVGVERLVSTLREGGTGSRSELELHPDSLPEKYEAGSHNTAGIAGLSEGVQWLLSRHEGSARGIDAVRLHEIALMRLMLDGLLAVPGLRLLGTTDVTQRVGVFSFVHPSAVPAELARRLEVEHGILSRAGLHCAPLMHRAMGTAPASGPGHGAARLSLGPMMAGGDIAAALRAVALVCGGVPRPALNQAKGRSARGAAGPRHLVPTASV